MTLPKRKYGDPLKVLLKDEAETCKGCRWRQVDGDDTPRCRNVRAVQIIADKRCGEYEEKNK